MPNNMIVKRFQNIELPPNRSAFLWGPRKTGKTTLLKQHFADAFWIDLLDYDLFEIKSSVNIRERPKGIHLFQEEYHCKKRLIVSRESLPRNLNSNITVLPWKIFCEMLWAGQII